MIDKLKWNLDELFVSMEECQKSFSEVETRIEELRKVDIESLDSNTLKRFLDRIFDCKSLAYKILVYGSLRYYADSNDEEMSNLKVEVEKLNAQTEESLNGLINASLNAVLKGKIDVDTLLKENTRLEEYSYFIRDYLKKAHHSKPSDEKTELLGEISSLNKRYNELLAKVEFSPITVAGKEVELTTANAPKYLASHDRSTREQAFISLNEGYKAHADEAAHILNEIMIRRLRISKIEEYSSVKEQSLDKENIDSRLLDELFSVVHQNRVHLQKYMATKAEYFGLKGAHLYDLGVPLDDGIKKKFPIEEGLKIARESFSLLGTSYSFLADDLIERGHVDAIPDDKKHQTITFSWLGYSFLNYRESYNDLKNLVHELGHSINDSLSQTLAFPYRISTVFAGETASITNEILLNRSLLERAESDEEKVFYLSKEIDNFVTSIYRQTMYTELEDVLYAKVASGITLTPEILNETYMNLLKYYYGDDIVYDELSAYEWMRVGRMYRWTYYSYTYATGLLIANSVYSNLKDGSTPIEDYIDFLSSGCKEDSLKLLSKLGIDFSNAEVMNRGFEVMASDIQDLQKLLTTKNFNI